MSTKAAVVAAPGLPPRSPNASALLPSASVGDAVHSPLAGHLSFLGAPAGNSTNSANAAAHVTAGTASTAVTQHIRALRRTIVRALSDVGRLAVLAASGTANAADDKVPDSPPPMLPTRVSLDSTNMDHAPQVAVVAATTTSTTPTPQLGAIAVSPGHSQLRQPPSPLGLVTRTMSQIPKSPGGPSHTPPAANSFLSHMLGRGESDVAWRKMWASNVFVTAHLASVHGAVAVATVTVPSHHDTAHDDASLGSPIQPKAAQPPSDSQRPSVVAAIAPSSNGAPHGGPMLLGATPLGSGANVIMEEPSTSTQSAPTPPPGDSSALLVASASNSGNLKIIEAAAHSLAERPPLGPFTSNQPSPRPHRNSATQITPQALLASRDAVLTLIDAIGQVYHGLERLPQLMQARRTTGHRRSIAGAGASGSVHPLQQYQVPWAPELSAMPSMSFVAHPPRGPASNPAAADPSSPIDTPVKVSSVVPQPPARGTSLARGVSFVNVNGLEEAAPAQPPEPAAPVAGAAVLGGARYRNQHSMGHLAVGHNADRRESVASVVTHPDLVETTRNYEEEQGLEQSGDQERINQYVLLSVIGQGAQGEVFMAYDTTTDEMRAIKCIPRPPYWNPGDNNPVSPSKSSGAPGGLVPHPPAAATGSPPKPSRAQRKAAQLSREIAIMKRCRHQHVVALYEVIDDPKAGKVYLVMQYIEHGPLLQLNDDGTSDVTFSPDEVAAYGRQICAGLCYLHEHNVVHRDIKPDNILLGDDNVVFLADFGVSELFAEDTDFSIRGKRGTKAFLAPEIVATEKDGVVADGKLVDVWALGLTFYLMLEGFLPWRFSTPQQYFEDTMHKPVTFSDAVPEKWRVILRGMLTVDTSKRWSSERARAEVKALHRELSDFSAAEVADAELSSAITRR